MCTSMRLKTNSCYFGRNLDLEYEFGERVVITPRNYEFAFRMLPPRKAGCAMIGMAAVVDDYPLYAEAMNEAGLYIAGLYFPGNAYYSPETREGYDNVSPFELIPWLLCQCGNLSDAKRLLNRLHLVSVAFRSDMPLTALHWHIADVTGSIVMEATEDGIHIYDDPADILTNNPPFPFHLANLRQYMGLSARQPEDRFSGRNGANAPDASCILEGSASGPSTAGADTESASGAAASPLQLSVFGQGMGAIGLPGDFSPASRFVKAAFLLANSASESGSAPSETDNVCQFFHILNGVAMVRGSVITPENRYDITTYTCCLSAASRTFYYTTYGNQQISAVCMDHEDLDGNALLEFPLVKGQQIYTQN